jgi:subtilisin family serine protease
VPNGFDPKQIFELGKNPGLGLRTLHRQGITGQGIGIAIIDQTLLTEHIEYADRLRWYEEIPGSFEPPAQMHGPAVASLAVGQTVGVAPGADLYYISGAASELQSIFLYSHHYAQAIERILQINEQLPAANKIRVISISNGWLPWIAGYQDVSKAVREAEAAGMLVLNVGTGTGLPNNISFGGLGRSPMADPDAFESYEPGIFWSSQFFEDGIQSDMVLVPMDSRAVADTASTEGYTFSGVGGGSWVPPYIAGLFALAAQVDPTITPDRFWSVALRTGRTVQVEHGDRRYDLGTIIDPIALVTELR